MTDIELNDKIVAVWRDIVKRSGNRQSTKKNLRSYKGCTISDEFKSLETFSLWYKSQVGHNLHYEVDKDLLVKGNKHYSSDTCVLIPKFLNGSLTASGAARGSLPLGVSFNPPTKSYVARCRYCVDGERRRKTIGYYSTPEDAFLAYKAFKEDYIKEQANVYRERISPAAYDALMRYTVDITD